MSDFRTITEIASDQVNTNENRAIECLAALDALSGDDLARPDFRAAAQTFALLAIAERADAISYVLNGGNRVP